MKDVCIPKRTVVKIEIEGEGVKTFSFPEGCTVRLDGGELEGRERISFPGSCVVEIDGEVWRISGATGSRLFVSSERAEAERDRESRKRFEAEMLERSLRPPVHRKPEDDPDPGGFGFGCP